MTKNILIIALLFFLTGSGLQSCDDMDRDLGYSLPDTLPTMTLTYAKATDMILIYSGAVNRPDWTEEELEPFVTFKNQDSGEEDWLFDGFLLINSGDGAGRYYVAPVNEAQRQRELGRKKEWEDQLDRQFKTDNAIDALNKLVTKKSAQIGAPARKRQVVICLPEPAPGQKDWGVLDGRQMDFSSENDRYTALKWYIDEIIKRWTALNPQNLTLAGFYWTAESAYISQNMLPTVKSYIKQKGPNYMFYHIPHWGAMVRPDWKKHGFDISYQQPNIMFNEASTLTVKEAVDYAKKYGMSMEFEFDAAALKRYDYKKRGRFLEYFNTFESEGIWESYPVTYYQDHKDWTHYLASTDPQDKELTYMFAKKIIERQKKADELVKE